MLFGPSMKKNNLEILSNNTHTKVLIVGGGIVGAGLFRDLALHGIDSIMIDRGDFSSQTSSRSSKMLHGGIRYLENFDFGLVFEALREKNLWLKLAPELCYESPFHIPVFKETKRPLWMIKIGLMLYDLLSSFKNSPHRTLTPKQALEEIPGLKSAGLKGAGLYYDSIVDDLKLTLEIILDSLSISNSHAFNYTQLVKVEKVGDVYHSTVCDTFNGAEKIIQSNQIIFALGPFTDHVLKKCYDPNWNDVLLPSKGSHLWLKKEALPILSPMLLNISDGRVIFIVPQKDMILVGTTEVKTAEDFFNIIPDKEEIDYLKQSLLEYFPRHPVQDHHILGSFAGIRPLIKSDETERLGKTAREHKIFRPGENIYVIAGGKYTTFRSMGQEITKNIVGSYGVPYNSNKSLAPLLHKSTIKPFEKMDSITREDIANILEDEMPKTFEDLVYRRLGIVSLHMWHYREDFHQFFESMIDLLEKHLWKFKKEDIRNLFQ